MHMSDLQTKEIIDISSGRRLGSISDIIVDSKGNITKILLDRKGGRKILVNQKEEVSLEWNQIIKIGDDIIYI